jgi:outer membrane protein
MKARGYSGRVAGRLRRRVLLSAVVPAAVLAGSGPVLGETLNEALSRAYLGNPTLNAQRAATRATDEGVPQALSGYRPRINFQADVGRQNSSATVRPSSLGGGTGLPAGVVEQNDVSYPRGGTLGIDQTLFDGFRTKNSVRQADATVLAARETLRGTEEAVLFNAVQAYMNVLRDFAILDLQRNNVSLLEEQGRATNARFNVGEVTRTDVAQAESRLAAARSQLSVAEANLKASRAVYRQVIGVDPTSLRPGRPADRFLPASVEAALRAGAASHPSILAALHNVDAALFRVKVLEGQLLPSVTVSGAVTSRWDVSTTTPQTNSASIVGRLTVPIYQGGGEYSQIRQAKETLGQVRIQADLARDQVRAAVVSAWGTLEGAKAQIIAAQAQVDASQIAFNGVQEEVKVGQRTTLDVLNAQQELLNARVALITAQRDRVVASYSVLQAIGNLTASRLGLRAPTYDPAVHYDQVRDKWVGLGNPDGR